MLLTIGLLMAAAAPQASEARVVRFVVEQRQLFAGGAEWGSSGAYERLRGTAYMEVDPRDPLNMRIHGFSTRARLLRENGHGRRGRR